VGKRYVAELCPFNRFLYARELDGLTYFRSGCMLNRMNVEREVTGLGEQARGKGQKGKKPPKRTSGRIWVRARP